MVLGIVSVRISVCKEGDSSLSDATSETVDIGSVYSGMLLTGGSIKFPFSSTPAVPTGSVYSGFSVLGASSGTIPTG
ncbi:Uncharacterised protein [Streptococcus pneumoniae]|nr:Uncharacterised protein [Streptococcus pneumoniae]